MKLAKFFVYTAIALIPSVYLVNFPNSLVEALEVGTNQYFSQNGTVYYTNGIWFCGFKKPGHLSMWQQLYRGTSISGGNVLLEDLNNSGVCGTPRAYFNFKGAVFYSNGDGNFCGFPNPDRLTRHQRRAQRLLEASPPSIGTIDSSPGEFMRDKGLCPDTASVLINQ